MGAYRPIAVNELYVEITRALSKEVEEIEESIDVAADIATKEALYAIKEDSPVRTGGYKRVGNAKN